MSLSNADKQQHGQSAQNSLQEILKRCEAAGYIILTTKNFRVGKEGYSNSSQFYVPFLIQFADGTKWAIFTTTSMRTDRIKGQQWDALNLKAIDPNIRFVYLVYPDGLPDNEKNEFVRQHSKYINGYEYSAIDGVLSQDQIYNSIEAYALTYMNSGQLRDRQGNEFESRIAAILSYPENLIKWKTGAPTYEGMHFDIFQNIVNCIGISPYSTIAINATSDKRIIGKLPSGGNPKTDVLISVKLNNGMEQIYTVSCKRSSDRSVSVHQYTADAFADVLNRNDPNLRYLLREFQRCGNLRDFGINNSFSLKMALQPYNEVLTMWVLGGFGGEGNEYQCANFIITYNNNTGVSTIHKIYDYYCSLMAAGVTGNFGTLFYWTYPSGRKGQSIQLKMRII
jgi:hypothetical protein